MKLYFREFFIGKIDEVLKSDGTWWGTFSFGVAAGDFPKLTKVLSYIQFCKEWNASQLSGSPRDAVEFDEYADVCESGFWTVVDSNLVKTHVEHAPNFLENDEVSWIEIT